MSPGIRRLALALAGFLTLGGTAAASAPRAAKAVPETWLQYGAAVNTALSAWLSDDSPASIAFRTLLNAERPTADSPGSPRVIRMWIDRRGTVVRAALIDETAADMTAALNTAVVGRHVDLTQPRRIRMPLRLEIQLQPNPAPSADPAATSTAGIR